MAINLGQLTRSRTDKHVAGVAGGIARFFDIDPVVVRVAFVVLAFFGGAGLLLYLGLWIFTPLDEDARVPFSMDGRSRALAIYIVAGLAVVVLLGTTFGDLHAPWFIWVIAAGALLLLWRERGRRVPYVRVRRGWVEDDEPTDPAAPPPAAGPTDEAGPVPPPPPPGGGTATYVAPPRVTFESFEVLPPRPRKPGPILFWFTLAVIALAEGVLGTIDVAGADIAGPAYAAVAVAVSGIMLVAGAFWGRPGGIILVGLLSSFALLASTAASEAGWKGHSDDISVTPATVASLGSTDLSWTITTGRLHVNLSHVNDPQDLDGRVIHLKGKVGELKLILPEGVGAEVHAEVHGPGSIQIGDSSKDGFHVEEDSAANFSATGPQVVVYADLGVGDIDIRDEIGGRA